MRPAVGWTVAVEVWGTLVGLEAVLLSGVTASGVDSSTGLKVDLSGSETTKRVVGDRSKPKNSICSLPASPLILICDAGAEFSGFGAPDELLLARMAEALTLCLGLPVLRADSGVCELLMMLSMLVRSFTGSSLFSPPFAQS